jgi:hypothetical protein
MKFANTCIFHVPNCLGWTPVDIGPSTLEKISSLVPLYKVKNVINDNVTSQFFFGLCVMDCKVVFLSFE